MSLYPAPILRRPLIARYSVMLMSVVVALLLTALIPVLRERESYVLFFGAVTLSAWYGGPRAGLLSCLLSSVVANYFITWPVFAFAWDLGAAMSMALFFVTALAISSLTSELARAELATREQWQQNIADRQKNDLKIQEYQVRLRSLASEVLLAEERERRRIANGLHDRVGQTLTACNIRVRMLINDTAEENSRNVLADVNKTLKEVIDETRSLTFELSPPTLYEFGLESALKGMFEEFSSKHHLKCEYIERGERVDIPVEIRVALFQVVRELLVNTIKHAEANCLSLTIENRHDSIIVLVQDNGAGFNVEEVSARESGFGLFSIRERVRHLGGKLKIDSSSETGTTVSLSIPLGHNTTGDL